MKKKDLDQIKIFYEELIDEDIKEELSEDIEELKKEIKKNAKIITDLKKKKSKEEITSILSKFQ